MIRVLGFDASTPQCPIVVGEIDDGGASRVLASDDERDAPNQASVRLVTRIEAVVERAGLRPADLQLIACGRGPGTFTGVRVALATAKGIAVGLAIPILPVSSLHALAFTAGTTALVLPLLDARRKEVYGALVELGAADGAPTLRHRTPERVASIEAVLEAAIAEAGDVPVSAVGTGAIVYRDRLPPGWSAPAPAATPSPESLLAAIVAGHRRAEAVDPSRAEATYLRQSYAELGINQPKRPFVKSPFV